MRGTGSRADTGADLAPGQPRVGRHGQGKYNRELKTEPKKPRTGAEPNQNREFRFHGSVSVPKPVNRGTELQPINQVCWPKAQTSIALCPTQSSLGQPTPTPNPRPLSALRTVAAARSPPAALPQHPALLLAARPSLAPPTPECRCVHSTHAPASPSRPALGLRTVAAAA